MIPRTISSTSNLSASPPTVQGPHDGLSSRAPSPDAAPLSVHSAGWLDAVGGFFQGVAQGVWNGAKGTVTGVVHLAEDGYRVATDGRYRARVWHSALGDAEAAGRFAATAVADPAKAAEEIGAGASRVWRALENAYERANARGQGSEFIGQLFGQGAVLAATSFVPGGAEADAVGVIGDGARVAELAADAGKAAAIGQDALATKDAGRLALTTIQRSEGRNTMEWNVDGEGRFVSGRAAFAEDFAGRKVRGAAEKIAQKEAAGRGVTGDQGGHIFAHRFVRDQGSINLVPQNGNLNTGAWSRMENEWADWIKAGEQVEVQVQAAPAGVDRPDAFRVAYKVIDPSNGKVLYSYSKRFLNQAGQQFDRLSASAIEQWKAKASP